MNESRDHQRRVFTCFPRLPTEIRLMIWDMAIQNRNAERLAHFFTLHNDARHDSIRLTKIGGPGPLQWQRQLSEWCFKTALGPPPLRHQAASTDKDFTEKYVWDHPSNPSGYLMDSGLWGACRESQEAIVNTWRQSHCGPTCCEGYKFVDSETCCPGNTEHLWTNGVPDYWLCGRDLKKNPYRVQITRVPDQVIGERWIVMKTRLDLVVCDMPDLATSLGHELNSIRSDHGRHDGMPNVALIYDPAWGTELFATTGWDELLEQETKLGGLVRQLEFHNHKRSSLDRIWFIDESLALAEDIPTVKLEFLLRHRKVFVAQGRRYVEVCSDEIGDCWMSRAMPEASQGSTLTADEFLSTLSEYADQCYDQRFMDGDDSCYGGAPLVYSAIHPDRLLACLPDEQLPQGWVGRGENTFGSSIFDR